MIQGGWPFVAWAYGIAYGGLFSYGLYLWYRVDRSASAHPSDGPTGGGGANRDAATKVTYTS